jgi:hypothetical protein
MTPDDELDARYQRWAHDSREALLVGVSRPQFMAMAEDYCNDCQTIVHAAGLDYCRECLQQTGGDPSRSLMAIASVVADRRALCLNHLEAMGIHPNGRWRDT